MSLWTPPKVARELRDARAQRDAEIVASLEHVESPEPYATDLQKIDPRLYLGRAKGVVVAGTALRPGYWHLIRDNSDKDAGLTVETIEGANGEYVEPNSALVEKVRRNDLQNPQAFEDRKKYAERRQMEEAKQQAAFVEEVVNEGVERWLAGNRAFISMDRSTPWTQSARARRE